MINIKEELKKNHERVDIISGKDNLDEITYEVVGNLKQKKFNNKVVGFIIAAALIGTVSYGAYTGYKGGYNQGYEAASNVSDLNQNNETYTIDTAPDIVVLKYLNYAYQKDSTIKILYEEANLNYSKFESESNERIIKKEDSNYYTIFRKNAKKISEIVPFGSFKYSLAKDENGEIIEDNTSSILIDNANCEVYMPLKEKIDTNNLPNDSFIKDGVLYVNYDNKSSVYRK